MKKSAKLLSVLLTLMLLFTAVIAPAEIYAHGVDEEEVTGSPEEDDGTSTTVETTTTTERKSVSISNFKIIGSNNKYYLCSPELSGDVDAYSFNIPDWMESVTLYIKAAKGLDISCDDADFKEDSGEYRGKISNITKSSQAYTVVLEGSGATRKLNITIRRSEIPCYFDSISMYKGDDAVSSSGSISDGMSYTLPSGTTGGVTLRVKPRHENEVTVTNLTGIDPSQVTGAEQKTTLELNTKSMRYDYKPTLVEGTNVFRFNVSAGSVLKTCDVTVIVGDANANAATTTTETQMTETSQADVPTSAPVTMATNVTTAPNGNVAGATEGRMSPILWVLIGVICTIILGAIVFMIVNLSSKRDDYDDYDDDYGYDDGYRRGGRGRGRRNLAEYVDDEYSDDEYYDAEQPIYRDQEEYDDRYGDGYSYDDTYDDYSSRRQYRDDYYDDDDNGGYGGRR